MKNLLRSVAYVGLITTSISLATGSLPRANALGTPRIVAVAHHQGFSGELRAALASDGKIYGRNGDGWYLVGTVPDLNSEPVDLLMMNEFSPIGFVYWVVEADGTAHRGSFDQGAPVGWITMNIFESDTAAHSETWSVIKSLPSTRSK